MPIAHKDPRISAAPASEVVHREECGNGGEERWFPAFLLNYSVVGGMPDGDCR